MKRDDNWNRIYEDVLQYMRQNGRRPSRHRAEDHKMLNWFKHNKKQLVRGDMPLYRQERFRQLVKIAESLTRINQYADIYTNGNLITTQQ